MNRRGYSAIGLYGPKTAENVGSTLRAAHCYGASLVVVHGDRFGAGHPANTPKAHRHVPFIQTDDIWSMVPYDCVPVAIEIEEGASPIQEFKHPERAFYIFGPEDGSIPIAISQKCKHRVYVPTRDCMNLAATVNVVLFDRMMKRQEYLR